MTRDELTRLVDGLYERREGSLGRRMMQAQLLRVIYDRGPWLAVLAHTSPEDYEAETDLHRRIREA